MSESFFKRANVFLIFSLCALMAFISCVSFSEKEVVEGKIAHAYEAVIRAPFSGKIKSLSPNGDVLKNQQIAHLISEDTFKINSSGRTKNEMDIELIKKEISDIASIYKISFNETTNNIEILQKSINDSQKNKNNLKEFRYEQLKTLKKREALLDKYRGLFLKGVYSERQFEDEQYALFLLKQDLSETESYINSIDIAISNFKKELYAQKMKKEKASIQYELDLKKLQIALENMSYIDNQQLISPRDGYFLSSSLNVGDQVSAGDAIGNIVSLPLIISLKVKSNSRAKLIKGAHINVSVDSFPYDKHGFLTALVDDISSVDTEKMPNDIKNVRLVIIDAGNIPMKQLTSNMSVKAHFSSDRTTLLRLLLLPFLNIYSLNKGGDE
ncbi:HlyD family secretion protein [Aeromonas veronii]